MNDIQHGTQIYYYDNHVYHQMMQLPNDKTECPPKMINDNGLTVRQKKI